MLSKIFLFIQTRKQTLKFIFIKKYYAKIILIRDACFFKSNKKFAVNGKVKSCLCVCFYEFKGGEKGQMGAP